MPRGWVQGREGGWGLSAGQYFDEAVRVLDLPPTITQRAVQSEPAELNRFTSRPVSSSFSQLAASSVTSISWGCLLLRNDSGDCWFGVGARAVEFEDGLSNMSLLHASL